MVDEAKNKGYLITIYFERAGKRHSKRFLSKHQMHTRKFKRFMKNYFKNVFPVNIKKIGYDGELGRQSTITNEDWKENKGKYSEGITKKEVCL